MLAACAALSLLAGAARGQTVPRHGGDPMPNAWGIYESEAGLSTGAWGRYDRVDGLSLGGGASYAKNHSTGTATLSSTTGYGFASERVVFRTAAVAEWFVPFEMSFRVEGYRVTDTEDEWTSSRFENGLAALLAGTDRFQYFGRRGVEAGGAYRHSSGRWSTDLFYRAERHESLIDKADFSLLDSDSFRPNRPALEGDVSTLLAVLRTNGMDDPDYPTRGWMADLFLEGAGGPLGSELDYARALAQVRYLRPVGLFNRLRVLGRAGAGNDLPPQKGFYLGGIGTLPGLLPQEMGGDRMWLVSADYQFGAQFMSRWDSPLLQAVRFNVFADAGDARPAGGDADPAFDAGFGLGDFLEILELDLARRWDEGRAPWRVHLRVRWPFA